MNINFNDWENIENNDEYLIDFLKNKKQKQMFLVHKDDFYEFHDLVNNYFNYSFKSFRKYYRYRKYIMIFINKLDDPIDITYSVNPNHYLLNNDGYKYNYFYDFRKKELININDLTKYFDTNGYYH